MITQIKRLWAAAPLATTALIGASVLALFFVIRLSVAMLLWHNSDHHEKDIEAWMTPGFISHAFNVPHEVILDAVDAPVPPPAGRMSLDEIATYRNVPITDVIAAAQAAVTAFHADRNAGNNGSANDR
ncbi:hypothetical protein [Celeribacter sp.]|uniref:hypothetical protein n=1 Tax=Celeribacter sp. TaxID=1890673 RepID=UPI003A8D6F05